MLLHHPDTRAPADPAAMRRLKAQYFGMIGEVDHCLGRLWDALVDAGAWDDTFVVVTADHGEQLGDHGYIQKAGFFEQSHHVVGIVRDPAAPAAHGTVVERFTENVDVLPTICDAIGADVPLQCDGLPLTPLLRGEDPPWWRDAATWEYDWRFAFITDEPAPWPWDQRLERQHLTVRRDDDSAYVQFGDGSWRCFDLAADPTWRTETTDPATRAAAGPVDAHVAVPPRRAHADRHAPRARRDRTMGRASPDRRD